MSSAVTVSTLTALTSADLSSLLGLLLVVLLAVLLINKDLAVASQRPHMKTFSRALNFAIAPLIIMFGMAAMIQLLTVL